jgi:hypothetical protein
MRGDLPLSTGALKRLEDCYRTLAVARRGAELPITHQSFADGELSFDQVHGVTMSVTVHDDALV